MKLDRLIATVDEFERIAFADLQPTLLARKNLMMTCARASIDSNLASILGRSVDYMNKHPEWVRAAIFNARSHIESLRASPYWISD